MKGNILGQISNLKVNGIIEEYETYQGQKINAGDFVEFIEKKKFKEIENSKSLRDCKTIELDDNKILLAVSDGEKIYLKLISVSETIQISSTVDITSDNYISDMKKLNEAEVILTGTSNSWIISINNDNELEVGTSQSCGGSSIAVLSQNKVVQALKDGSNYIVRILNISNKVITTETETSIFSPVQYGGGIEVVKLNENKALALYSHGGNNYVRILNISSGTISAENQVSLEQLGYYIKAEVIDENNVVVFGTYSSSNQDTNYYAILLQINDDTITASTKILYATGRLNSKAHSIKIANNKITIFYAFINSYVQFCTLSIENGEFVLSDTGNLDDLYDVDYLAVANVNQNELILVNSSDIDSLYKLQLLCLRLENYTVKDFFGYYASKSIDKNSIKGIAKTTSNSTIKVYTLLGDVIDADERISLLQETIAEQNRLLELYGKNVKKAEIEEEYITVTDSAEMDSSIILKGNSIQEETPTRNSPVEIKNVTGNIKFTVCEKNLLNFDSAVASSNVSNISILDDNIALTASNANNNMAIDVPIKLKTSKTYSIKQTSSTCQLRNDDEELIYNVSNKTFDTFSLTSKADFVRFWFDTSKIVDGTVTVKKSDFMLVEGSYTESTMPDYEAYSGQTIEFPLNEKQKMLEESYLADDGIHHKRTQIELNGTENFLIGFDSIGNGFKRFSCSGLTGMKNGADNHIICSHFIQVPYSQTEPNTRNKECIASAAGTNYRIMFVVNSEDFTTDQDFKNWLTEEHEAGTPVKIEYELSEENEIVEEYTAEQQAVYNKLKKYTLKKGINNIFSTDDISPIFKLTYTKATDIVIETLEYRITVIEGLLSTTATAAMLIENKQSDLESEVNNL